MPCQDVQDCRVLPGGLVLAVVADGAGTARLAEQGARTAVGAMVQALEFTLTGGLPEDSDAWNDLIQSALLIAREAVLLLADDEGESPREYACTLVTAIATPGLLVIGQIGDGAVIARGKDGSLFSATHLQRGEYANETYFLVQEDALKQAVVEIYERPISGLAVMSDGLIRLALKMPSQEPHAPFFEPLFEFASQVKDATQSAAQLAKFLESERVNNRTDDDKALVLAVTCPGEQDV